MTVMFTEIFPILLSTSRVANCFHIRRSYFHFSFAFAHLIGTLDGMEKVGTIFFSNILLSDMLGSKGILEEGYMRCSNGFSPFCFPSSALLRVGGRTLSQKN